MNERGLALDRQVALQQICLLYTSDAADERSSVDLGGRRIIKKKNEESIHVVASHSLVNIHVRCYYERYHVSR